MVEPIANPLVLKEMRMILVTKLMANYANEKVGNDDKKSVVIASATPHQSLGESPLSEEE